jgi:hypothetical protein
MVPTRQMVPRGVEALTTRQMIPQGEEALTIGNMIPRGLTFLQQWYRSSYC